MRVHIVGGGFSGLTLAFFLKQRNVEVTIYEKEHWGGCIHTLNHRSALIELAANGFLASDLFDQVSRQAGCSVRGVDGPQGRYIYSNHKARRWPLGLSETLRLIGTIFRFIFFRPSLVPQKGESVSDWAARTMGEGILHNLLEPALRGVYAGQVKQLSANLILGKWFKQNTKRTPPEKKGLMTGTKGMEGWLQDLVKYLKMRGVVFQDRGIEDLKPLLNGNDIVVLATPPHEAATLLDTVNDQRSEVCRAVEMVPVASVTLLSEAPAPLQGFGCLFPERENFAGLGVLFRQSFFPEAKSPHQERWILNWKNESESELIEKVEKDRNRLWGSSAPQIQAHHVKIWPKALPHYTTKLEQQLQALNEIAPNSIRSQVFLHGNYLGALGLTALLERSANLADTLGSLSIENKGG